MLKYYLDDVEDVAKKLIQQVHSKILFFKGPMGVGKTTLIKAVVKQLGSNDEVSSPTFSIVNEYCLENGNSIFHFDLYRLKSFEEALDFGIEEYLYSGDWCLVEWPELIQDNLSMNFDSIDIQINDDQSRILSINCINYNDAPSQVL